MLMNIKSFARALITRTRLVLIPPQPGNWRPGEVLKKQMDSGQLPAVQPHHALAYPIAAEQQLRLAKEYAAGANTSQDSVKYIHNPTLIATFAPLSHAPVAANKILNFFKKTLHTDASVRAPHASLDSLNYSHRFVPHAVLGNNIERYPSSKRAEKKIQTRVCEGVGRCVQT